MNNAHTHPYTVENLHSVKHIKKGPFLGLDWGRKRTGIALSDPDNTVAMPFSVVQTGGMLRATLKTLWNDYAVQALIIGWPLHANGQKGVLCDNILRLAKRLDAEHQWPIALWDERFTTRGVNAVIIKKKSIIDDHAAALILEGAMRRWHNIKKQTP